MLRKQMLENKSYCNDYYTQLLIINALGVPNNENIIFPTFLFVYLLLILRLTLPMLLQV